MVQSHISRRLCLTATCCIGLLVLVEASAWACVSLDDIRDQQQQSPLTLPGGGTWQATYWNNTGMFGAPALVRNESAINAFYGDGSPAAAVNADNYSARWTRETPLAAGVYRFTATADDGVRVFVDGQLVLDQWDLHDSTTFVADVAISAGSHTITVEYFEHTGHSEIRFDVQALQQQQ